MVVLVVDEPPSVISDSSGSFDFSFSSSCCLFLLLSPSPCYSLVVLLVLCYT